MISQVNQQLKLSRLHATEWRALLALEVESQSALEQQHSQQSSQAQLRQYYWRRQAAMVTHQLGEIKALQDDNQQKREEVRNRQIRERIVLKIG